MVNGKPHDHPVTDIVLHGLHPYPPDLEELVRQVNDRNPGVFNDLEWAPFDWEKGRFLDEARRLLQGLLQHHGDPDSCRRHLEEYRASTSSGGRNLQPIHAANGGRQGSHQTETVLARSQRLINLVSGSALKKTLGRVYVFVSLTLFIAFTASFIGLLTGKSDFLPRILQGYLAWLKQGPILIVLLFFTTISVVCSRIFTVGICANIVARNERFASKIFWSVLAIFMAVQLAGLWLLRRAT